MATLRDLAISSTPQHLREALLTFAGEHGIQSPEDPFWTLALAYTTSLGATAATGAHVEELRASLERIRQIVYESAQKAGGDLSGVIAASINSTVEGAGNALVGRIDKAAVAGAAALQKAASGLDDLAAQKTNQFVENWKGQVIKGINSHARIALAWHLSKSWATVVTTVAVAMVLGAGVGLGSAFYYHKLITVRDISFYQKGAFPTLPATVVYDTSRIKQISCGVGRTCLSPD